MAHLFVPIALALILENIMPRFKNLSSFSRLQENLFWLFLNAIIFPFLIAKISWWVGSHSFFQLNLLSESHPLIQFIVGFFFLELFRYVLHYLFHRIPLLWTFHKVHHSIEDLNALASFRQSWIELFITIFLTSLLLIVFGFNFSVVVALNIISMFVCIFQHANIKTPHFKKWEMLFITPENHRIHHAKELKHKYGQNFGFCLNIWDRAFGTYISPGSDEIEIGLAETDFPKHFWDQFLHPFLKKTIT